MNRPQLLLIAYHFPPDSAIGGARPFRFYKYMKRLGYDCHVLTASPQPARDGHADVEYVPDPLRTKPRQGWAWQAERIGWKFFLRGEWALGWSHAAWRAGRCFLEARAGNPVTIVSSAPPLGTHIAASRLSRFSDSPWIADFRDPIHSPTGEHAVLQAILGPWLERLVLTRANLVLANTDSMRDAWSLRYPDLAAKIHVLWNGYDPEDAIRPESIPERRRKVLSHVGELYGGRDIQPILQSVARLVEHGRLAASDIEIIQVGATEPAELPPADFLRRAETEGWLQFRQPVPAAEARSVALNSDGLLLIQPHTAVQVPGKLFEYLRMGRPILAYVIPGSPVERILESAGVPFACIYPEHTPEETDSRIAAFLKRLTGPPVAPSLWFEENFSAPRQVEILHRLVQSVRTS